MHGGPPPPAPAQLGDCSAAPAALSPREPPLRSPVDPDKRLIGRYDSNGSFLYPCRDLYQGWATVMCPQGPDRLLPFGRDWHRRNLEEVWSLAQRHAVPLHVNQWQVSHGITAEQGRYAYIADLMEIARGLDIGWTWWTFLGGGYAGEPWKYGASNIIFKCEAGAACPDGTAGREYSLPGEASVAVHVVADEPVLEAFESVDAFGVSGAGEAPLPPAVAPPLARQPTPPPRTPLPSTRL